MGYNDIVYVRGDDACAFTALHIIIESSLLSDAPQIFRGNFQILRTHIADVPMWVIVFRFFLFYCFSRECSDTFNRYIHFFFIHHHSDKPVKSYEPKKKKGL